MGKEVTRDTSAKTAATLDALATRVREMLVEGGFVAQGPRGDQGPQGFRGIEGPPGPPGKDADTKTILEHLERGLGEIEDLLADTANNADVVRLRRELNDLKEQLGKVRIPVGGGGGPPHPPARTGSDVYWVLANFPDDDPRAPVWHDAADLPGGAGGGAPTNATYLVTTANATLTNEVVVGATPGGELGGTWDSFTVDAVHSGSSHAAVQAAAEATAAAALAAHVAAADPHTVYQRESEKGVAGGYASLDGSALVPDAQIPSTITRDTELAAHEADTTAIHGIADTSLLETTAGAQAKVDAHTGDASDAHDASAISSVPAGGLAADDVQEALNELDTEKTSLTTFNDHSARHESGGADAIKLDDLAAPDDNTDLNASTTAHGLLRKLSNVATEYLDGTGVFSTPAGGGSGLALTRAIAQVGHGLTVGDVVRYNGTAYVEAKADTAVNAEVVGIVSVVTDADNFTLLLDGYISTLSGLTAGAVYFLSASASGVLTTTEPSSVGQVSKPLLIAVSTTAGYFVNFRGIAVGAATASAAVNDFNTAFLMGGM